MNWEQIEKLLSSGEANHSLRYGKCIVRPTHQEGRAMMRYALDDIPYDIYTAVTYDSSDVIVATMKRIQPDSDRWK